MDRTKFKHTILDYYAKSGRHSLPWRQTRDPYRIMVSEIMLQQTQVPRVITKYQEFLKLFPTAATLAKAKTLDVLKAWQGLGYNRRALALKRAAEAVVREHGGKFPRTLGELIELPGVGPATAGGILAYAFGIPTAFIETNIRAVFIHHFFPGKSGSKKTAKIHDRDIMPLIEETLDRKNPRDWYYALMDYGVHLKQTLPNPSRRSRHHAKQSRFEGSNREVRSKILKFVLTRPATDAEIVAHIGKTAHDVSKNIAALVAEGFLERNSAGKLRVV
jgi:A/G-specific adenine glycosylase